jgi:putative endonuclease
MTLGPRGERLAARYLSRQGLRIVARSYVCPIGEIDLIALHGEVLVIVEVRTRSNSDHGEPWETIGPAKQRKLTALASFFLKHEPEFADRSVRFDVVSIEWFGSWGSKPVIRYFPGAFGSRGPWR